jgi:hypothetical protein
VRLFAKNESGGPRDLLANSGTEVRSRFQIMFMGG